MRRTTIRPALAAMLAIVAPLAAGCSADTRPPQTAEAPAKAPHMGPVTVEEARGKFGGP